MTIYKLFGVGLFGLSCTSLLWDHKNFLQDSLAVFTATENSTDNCFHLKIIMWWEFMCRKHTGLRFLHQVVYTIKTEQVSWHCAHVVICCKSWFGSLKTDFILEVASNFTATVQRILSYSAFSEDVYNWCILVEEPVFSPISKSAFY